MKLLQIMELVEKRKNVIFYNRNVYDCYEKLKDDYICIYFSEPIPNRLRMIEIVNLISPDYHVTVNVTIGELKKIILHELNHRTLIIIFNNFDRLTQRTVEVYQYLNGFENIQFICSFNKNFKKEVFPLFQTFELINRDKYKKEMVKEEINVTYAIYAVLSIYCFLIYMKSSFSLFLATILIGAVWFALIIFRTLMYAGGRI